MFPYMKLIWIALFAVAMYFILPHAFPILLALVTAILLEPIVKMLQNTLNVRRVYSVSLTFTGFLLIVGGLLYFVTTRIVIEVVELSQWVPTFMMTASEPIRDWFAAAQVYFEELPPKYAANIQTALSGSLDQLNTLTGALLDGLISFIKSLPNLIVVSMVYIVSLFLILLDLPSLARGFIGLFAEESQMKVKLVLENLNRAIIGFIQAQVLISFLTYDLVLVGLWILDVKYALAVALIIVIVDVLPVLGTGAVIVPWTAYAFLTNNQSLGIGLIVLYVVIVVFRRIVEPKILGHSLGISALATLISMYLGFMLFGFFGLIIGPALIIIFKAFMDAGIFTIRIKL